MKKRLELAKQRLESSIEEMGCIKNVHISSGTSIVLEFENGRNIKLHDKEVLYQALERIEEIKQEVIHS